MDWNTLLPATGCSYVLGNPPFIGHHLQSASQKDDQKRGFMRDIQGTRVLDYVCNWYVKAAEYIQGINCPVGFVSTNSILKGNRPEFCGIIFSLSIQLKDCVCISDFCVDERGSRERHMFML